jgi:IclR family KDG regulon transcriptional repressor
MLVKQLLELGYLEYDPRARTYAPSVRVALLGSWIDRRFKGTGAISERLEDLQRTLGLTAYVAVQNAAAVQHILTVRSSDPDCLDVSSGMYGSLTCSAVGRALMSRMRDGEILSWLRRCNAEAPSQRLRVRESELLAEIGKIRAQGFAEVRSEPVRGMDAVALSLDPPMGATPLAVGVGGPVERIESEKNAILAALRKFAASFRCPPAILVAPMVGSAAGLWAGGRRAEGWRAPANSTALDVAEPRRANGAG